MSCDTSSLPVIRNVDVLVIGGSTAAVAAATEARRAGATVFLAAAESYLGEDLASHARWWRDPEGVETDPLIDACWRDEQGEPLNPTRPQRIKLTLDRAMLDAGVDFLFNLTPLYVFQDDAGKGRAVAFATRSGVVAVRAGVVIDASPRAIAARSAGDAAGLSFRAWEPGEYEVQRIVVGGKPDPEGDVRVEPLSEITIHHKNRKGEVTTETREAYRCTLRSRLDAPTPAAFNRVEHEARDRTWHADAVTSSDRVLWTRWTDTLRGRRHCEAWPDDVTRALDACRGESAGWWILSRCADFGPDAAAAFAHPDRAAALGRCVGREAARSAASCGDVDADALKPLSREGAPSLAAGETWRQVMPDERPARDATGVLGMAEPGLPVLDEVDVLVVGGGTGGAPAGIAAARQGARTLVLESLAGLGGVGTLGMISVYYHGYRGGFTAEVTEGLYAMSPEPSVRKGMWRPDHKAEWLRRQIRDAGGETWFHACVTGVVKRGDDITAAVVATPFGAGLVRTRQVIDATGNADVAALAGAACTRMAGDHVAVQGSGLPPVHAPSGYTNTDYDFFEDADLLDVWRAFVNGREMFADAFDFGQLVDTRERRQIVGDFRIDPIDIFAGRTYPDSVALSRSNFDTHGFTVHPLFVVKPPDRESLDAYIPLRALLARDLDNVMATGLGLSGHRDAMPVLRMQACTQNHAFAAGTAAALAVKADTPLRQLDLAPLRRHMVDVGILPAEALEHADNFPASDEAMHDAIADGLDSYRDLAVLMSDPQRAVVLLQSSLAAATGDGLRLCMAMLLAVLGDDAGADLLLQRLEVDAWDEGWNYRGMGQFGMSMSELDRTIVALAMARETQTLPPLLKLARQLDSEHAFSHHRATAIACETFADPDAAPVLAEVLHKPHMRGHAFRDMAVIRRGLPRSSTETTPRNHALRELHLARALFRCGDHDGLGKAVLREYAEDFRGCFARHARAVLAGAPAREAEPLRERRGETTPLHA